MAGITDFKPVIRESVSFHRLSAAVFANNSGGFLSEEGRNSVFVDIHASPLRNERPEMSGAKPTNCYSERRTKPRKKVARRCVIGSRAEIPRKEPKAQNDAGIARLVFYFIRASCRH